MLITRESVIDKDWIIYSIKGFFKYFFILHILSASLLLDNLMITFLLVTLATQ